MQDLLDGLNTRDVPHAYLDHAIVTDLTGQEHRLSASAYHALTTRAETFMIVEAKLYMDGQRMADDLKRKMASIYWPLGWAE